MTPLARSLVVLALFCACTNTAMAEAPRSTECRSFSTDACMISMTWAALIQWADAWSNKDYEAYKHSYDKSTSPQLGKTRTQWLEGRKRALATLGKIKISLNLIDVQYLDENETRATVIQRYTAPHYSDIVLKTFRLNLQQGQVKILNERVNRSLTPLEADAIIDEFGY